MSANPNTVSLLLTRLAEGDVTASEELWPHVYDELRALARQHLGRSAERGSIQPTMLVHEAWLRVASWDVELRERRQFFFLASKVMRSVLVDAARKRSATKRGGGRHQVTLELDLAADRDEGIDMLELNETLDRLAEHSERLARLVELRVFGGLSHAECAEALGCSLRTVERDWNFARVWLYDELSGAEGG